MFVWAYSLFHWLYNPSIVLESGQGILYILIRYQETTVTQKYNGNAIIIIATSTPPQQDPSTEKKEKQKSHKFHHSTCTTFIP